jgi:hypothetical protein
MKPLTLYHEPRLDLCSVVKKYCVENNGVLFSQCKPSLYKNAGRRLTGRARFGTRLNVSPPPPLESGLRGGHWFTDQKFIIAGDLCFMWD